MKISRTIGTADFEQKRRVGVVEARQDQAARVAQIGGLVETPDQAALAAAAFENLRL